MAEALPEHPIRTNTMQSLTVEQVLSEWHLWPLSLTARPSGITPLSGGLTNTSYLLQEKTQQWVLKLYNSDSQSLGINRNNELKIHHAAEAAGLSPPLRYTDPLSRYSISDYIASEQPDYNHSTHAIEAVALLLHKTHSLPCEGERLDIIQYTLNYWQVIDRQKKQGLLAPHKEYLIRYFAIHNQRPLQGKSNHPSIDQRLCHNDPVGENILFHNHQFYLIDWEYAAIGDPFFDLAVFACSQKLNKEKTSCLLKAYQDNGSSRQHFDKLFSGNHTENQAFLTNVKRFNHATLNMLYIDLLWHLINTSLDSTYRIQSKLKNLLKKIHLYNQAHSTGMLLLSD